ncbi:hypothetical protein CERSUDRAFT_159128 [Gelatoporia subvermispora B]|uniref:AIG1-type G domain-containing protein n=1 Tax=Ceriporiopsis subvermispora (strain B) TaxID=914234 RepID=M2QNZ0_CERS8|nr:hypothetical protein CERSUDRAFT_159128 [Gelatoporia subvermispora B]
MGPTGAGKSKFINTVTGSQFRVGTGLESCTGQVEVATLELDGELVTLVDTPGFDDSTRSQTDVLKEISTFLRQSYELEQKVAGILYLHRISDFRMSGIARENFRMFRKICGSGAMKNVAIVTNMWGEVKEEVGLERERELASKPLFFKDAIDNGARMVRYHDSRESGHSIIRSLLGMPPRALQIQQETVDEQKSLPQTTAGTELQDKLDEHKMKFEEELADVRREFAEARANMDRTELQELQDSMVALREKVARVEAEKRKLLEDSQEQKARLAEALRKVAETERNMEAMRKHYDSKVDALAAEIRAMKIEAEKQKVVPHQAPTKETHEQQHVESVPSKEQVDDARPGIARTPQENWRAVRVVYTTQASKPQASTTAESTKGFIWVVGRLMDDMVRGIFDRK